MIFGGSYRYLPPIPPSPLPLLPIPYLSYLLHIQSLISLTYSCLTHTYPLSIISRFQFISSFNLFFQHIPPTLLSHISQSPTYYISSSYPSYEYSTKMLFYSTYIIYSLFIFKFFFFS